MPDFAALAFLAALAILFVWREAGRADAQGGGETADNLADRLLHGDIRGADALGSSFHVRGDTE